MTTTRTFMSSMGAAVAGPSSSARASMAGLVRWAELDVDPAMLDEFKAATRALVDAVLRAEPGVAAYRAHLESPHFRKYVETTQPMVSARRLVEARVVFLGQRPR